LVLCAAAPSPLLPRPPLTRRVATATGTIVYLYIHPARPHRRLSILRICSLSLYPETRRLNHHRTATATVVSVSQMHRFRTLLRCNNRHHTRRLPAQHRITLPTVHFSVDRRCPSSRSSSRYRRRRVVPGRNLRLIRMRYPSKSAVAIQGWQCSQRLSCPENVSDSDDALIMIPPRLCLRHIIFPPKSGNPRNRNPALLSAMTFSPIYRQLLRSVIYLRCRSTTSRLCNYQEIRAVSSPEYVSLSVIRAMLLVQH
jgi:hypothetical protein